MLDAMQWRSARKGKLMSDEAVEVRITGRVQGVGFRAWAAREARALGLAGWVRNEPDGSVAALLAGEPAVVGTMLERLRHGPAAAAVEKVAAQPAEATHVPGEFRILR